MKLISTNGLDNPLMSVLRYLPSKRVMQHVKIVIETCAIRFLLAKMATHNVNIPIKTNELLAVPDATRELKLHFTTIPRLTKKDEVFSFPIHSVDYLHINDIQALKLKMNEG
jgi:hypothetical protein